MSTRYEKRGRRYYPIEECLDTWRFSKGSHLVTVSPGHISGIYNIDPDKASLIAATKQKEDKIIDIVKEAFAMRPAIRELTPKQIAAWRSFEKAMGCDRYAISYDSIVGIAEKIFKAIMEEE